MNTQNIKHCWAHEACHAQTHNNMGSFTNSAPVNPIFSVSSHSWNSSPPLLLLLLFFLRLGHPACLPHFSLVSGLENKPDKSFYQPALRKGQCWGVCQKEGKKKGGGGSDNPLLCLIPPCLACSVKLWQITACVSWKTIPRAVFCNENLPMHVQAHTSCQEWLTSELTPFKIQPLQCWSAQI